MKTKKAISKKAVPLILFILLALSIVFFLKIKNLSSPLNLTTNLSDDIPLTLMENLNPNVRLQEKNTNLADTNSSLKEDADADLDMDTLNLKNKLKTKIWFEDTNHGNAKIVSKEFKEMFENPNTWKEARKYLDVYTIRARWVYDYSLSGINDSWLKEKFIPLLKKENIKLAIDVGGATLSNFPERKDIIDDEIKAIQKIQANGGEINYILLQSPLSKAPKDIERKDYSLETRIDNIVKYCSAIKENFPNNSFEFGIIDSSIEEKKELWKYDEAYLKAITALKEKGIILNNIIFDIPAGMAFRDWNKVKERHNYVKNNLNLNFGMIVTGSIPVKNDKEYFEEVTQLTQKYFDKVGDYPDFFWNTAFKTNPSKTIPETENYTMTNALVYIGKSLLKCEKNNCPDLMLYRYRSKEKGDILVTTRTSVENDYEKKGVLGSIYSQSASDRQPLYECLVNDKNNMLSLQENCEGHKLIRIAGYIKKDPAEGFMPIRRCFVKKNKGAFNHFVSRKDNCEGRQKEGILGYVYLYGNY